MNAKLSELPAPAPEDLAEIVARQGVELVAQRALNAELLRAVVNACWGGHSADPITAWRRIKDRVEARLETPAGSGGAGWAEKAVTLTEAKRLVGELFAGVVDVGRRTDGW